MAHCPVPPLASGQIEVPGGVPPTTLDPGVGSRRAIVTFFHQSKSDVPIPAPIDDVDGFSIKAMGLALQAQGYVFEYPNYAGDWRTNNVNYPSSWIADVSADAGHGSQLTTTHRLFMDHLDDYHTDTYGPNRPLILMGFSEGAFMTVMLTALNSSVSGRHWNIVGFAAHCLPTIWENIAGFTPPSNWSGYDLSTTYLSACAVPGIIGLSNTDATVGYSLTPDFGGPNSNGLAIATSGLNTTLYHAASSTASGLDSWPAGSNPVAYPIGHLWQSRNQAGGGPTDDGLAYYNWIVANMSPICPANAF